MDPELASEMVKLLAQELKVVRAQLCEAQRTASSTPGAGDPSNRLTRERAHALVAENESLKADNAALQARISRLQGELTQLPSVKSEEGMLDPLQYMESMAHMREEFARLLAEKEDLVREKEDAAKRQGKLSVLREKYKQTKAKAHEYSEVLNELRVELANCTQELEQSRKAVVSEIDFRDFLHDLPCQPVEGQLEFASIQPHSRSIHADFREDLVDVCQGPYFLHCNEVIWSPSGISLGLVFWPTFQYNPRIRGGVWTKLENDFDVGKQMDVCCLTGKECRYLGTYERVGDHGSMVIAQEALRYLDNTKMQHASKRTTLFPDLVPPSQTNMIKNMYWEGVLKLQCFGIRYVAFNEAFAEKLRNICTSSAPQNRPGNSGVPTVTSRDDRKRKRGLKSAVHSTKHKKRKQ